MKKSFCLFILILSCLFLSSCNTEIRRTLYISSFGFDFSDGNIKGYFLINPLGDISRSKEDGTNLEYIMVEGKSIVEVFANVDNSVIDKISFNHLQSAVFTKDFLASQHFASFLAYMQNTRSITYNFYAFATTDKLEDIFGYDTINVISYQNSILSTPYLENYEHYGVSHLHFLDLANNYYNQQRFIHIPYLQKSEPIENKSNLKIAGYANIGEQVNFYSVDEYYIMQFLCDRNYVYYEFEGKQYEINNYSFEETIIDGVYTFLISYEATVISRYSSSEELRNNIYQELSNYFDKYIEQEGSLYYVDFYNYINKKTLDASIYNIIIKNH